MKKTNEKKGGVGDGSKDEEGKEGWERWNESKQKYSADYKRIGAIKRVKEKSIL